MKRTILFISIFSLVSAVVFTGCKKDEEEEPIVVPVIKQSEAFIINFTQTDVAACGQWGKEYFEGAFNGDNSVDVSKLNGIAAHIGGTLQSTVADDLKSLHAVTVAPNLSVGATNYDTNTGGWINAIIASQLQAPSCAVGVLKSIDGTTMTIRTKTKFYNAVGGDIRLAVYIAENNVKATQAGTTDNNHIYVLRGKATATFGNALTNSASAGAEYDKDFTFAINGSWNASNLKAIAVLYVVDISGKPFSCLNSHTH